MPLVDRLPSAPTPNLIRATWTSDHPRPRSNNTPGESARMAEPSPLSTGDRYGLGTDGTLRGSGRPCPPASSEDHVIRRYRRTADGLTVSSLRCGSFRDVPQAERRWCSGDAAERLGQFLNRQGRVRGRAGVYWRAIATFMSVSVSGMRSPERSIVTRLSVPVKAKLSG